jgi:hypothetical protein
MVLVARAGGIDANRIVRLAPGYRSDRRLWVMHHVVAPRSLGSLIRL